MSFGKRALSVLGRLGIIIAIAVAFLFGLGATIYLSLRTSEVKVPDIIGKDFLAAETVLGDAGLNVRKRATRPTGDKPNVILDQLPHAGEIVKVGQTVAVDVSRAPKEGEAVQSSNNAEKPATAQSNEHQNTNESTAAKNQNGNQNNSNNQNKRAKNANNKNANNSNNANNGNANRSANNRNANNGNNTNNRNVNANRTTNANGGNRNATNLNANRRAPTPTTPPSAPGGNTRTP